ncbi:MAG: hypothetical protein H0V27_03935 [Pyrinomonadaceae bacterium]|nr:hypothetical protein [Pyrinomonadaceae bacterium]
MIPTHLSLLRLVFVVLLFSSLSPAQSAAARFDFYTRGPYRENVPRPQTLLRYDVGEFHTNYSQMERVLERIATTAPDRVRVTDIGETNEHRTMHLVAVSAPENLQRLDQIKANIKRLSDPRTLAADEARRITADTPLVVWLSYTIHGNESASFEAMMQVLYQLAASNEGRTLDVLKNCVVLINVCSNPDGHERFVTWYNSFGIGNPEPAASEHREPWSVFGRVNRYRFDLNRDNLVSSQRETRNMQAAYLEWNPQVFVDHHGQPAQFFFPPAAQPINPNLPAAQTARWLTAFGRANAREFDQRNWDFYVRDIFDLFYPGYWDSWPSLNGATGMTYETDGGGWKGLNWRRDDDTIVTFRSAIAKHFVASLTTLETAAQNRAARLSDYYEFKRSAIEEGRNERVRRFVILPGSDPVRAAELVEILLRAGIEVGRSSEAFRSTRAHDYMTANSIATAQQFPAGAFIVDLAQPQKRLAKALLEPNTNQDAAFTREQIARFQRNQRRGENAPKEDYGFYDITAWSLPLAFGVEAYWTEDAASVSSTPLLRQPQLQAQTGENIGVDANGNVIRRGPGIPELSPSPLYSLLVTDGGVTGRAQIAYIIPYGRNAAASVAIRLLQENYKLAVATRPLNAGGRDYPRGTMIARVSRNPETLHERIAQLARETGVQVAAVNTGFIETGETGVGSETVVSLVRPRIIVVADEPVSQTSYGALWWTFDRYGVDFTPMTINALRSVRLDNYNVIIMPDGSPGGYFAAFGKPGVEALRAWAQRGGTLVCIKGAAAFAALKDVNLTSSRLVGSDDDEQRNQQGENAAASPTPSPIPQEAATAANAQREQTVAPTTTGRDRRGRRERRTPQSTSADAATQPTATQPASQSGQTSAPVGEENQTEKMQDAPPDLPPIASPSARPGRVPEAVPGAIMRATVDRTTPLTYGYESPTLPALVASAYFFRASKEGTNAVVFAGEPNQTLRIAGFTWPNNTERLLRGTSYIFEEPTGRGHVVLYAEDPNFRGIWRVTTRLFFNSLLFQPTF